MGIVASGIICASCSGSNVLGGFVSFCVVTHTGRERHGYTGTL